MPADAEEVGQEEQRNKARTQQVDKEYVENWRLAQPHEVEEVEPDVQKDEQQLQRSKADRPLLETQVAEGDGLQGIEGNHRGHHRQVFRMVSIADGTTDGTDKAEDQQQEYSRERCNSSEGGGENGVGLGLFIVGKAEQRGLHAKGQ